MSFTRVPVYEVFGCKGLHSCLRAIFKFLFLGKAANVQARHQREQDVGLLQVIKLPLFQLVHQLDGCSEASLADSQLAKHVAEELQISKSHDGRVDHVLEALLLVVEFFIFHRRIAWGEDLSSVVAQSYIAITVVQVRELDVNDPSVEDVDKALVVLDILVDPRDVEVGLRAEGQLLQREKMLKDEAARLEEHVSEALFPICRLEHAKAAGVTETSVEPAPDQDVCEHADLAGLQFDLAALGFTRSCSILPRQLLRLHHNYPHHGSNSVGHLVCADYEALHDAMDQLYAVRGQVLFLSSFGDHLRVGLS